MPVYLGILSAVSITIILFKFGKGFYKKLIGYDWLADMIITFGIPIAVGATYSGLVLGVITGLVMSGVFYVSRNIMGYSKLVRNGKWYKYKWVDFEGDWADESINDAKINGNVDSFITKSNDSISETATDAKFTELPISDEVRKMAIEANKKNAEIANDPAEFQRLFHA